MPAIKIHLKAFSLFVGLLYQSTNPILHFFDIVLKMLKGSLTQKLMEALETHPNSQTHFEFHKNSTHANSLESFAGHVRKTKPAKKKNIINIRCSYTAHVVSSMCLEASSVQFILKQQL